MQHKKQVVLNILTIVAMLFAVIGIVPASASLPSLTSSSASSASLKQLGTNNGDAAEGLSKIAKSKLAPNKDGGDGEIEGDPLVRDDWFYTTRATHDPNVDFTLADAAALRAEAANQLAGQLGHPPTQPASPLAFGGAWTSAGPNPMVLVDRGDGRFDAMAGRIGALAIRSTPPYTMYLGGAQGGVWTMASPYTGTWTPKTDNLPSLAIGALALAPSNENIVYVGTGEGALSGDSYFGNGVLKSIDGGGSFFKVSASGYFTKVSISKIVVNNTDPNTLYVGTLRGRGGVRRTSPPDASAFGVWKSIDGGVNWTMVLTASTNALDFAGVTDLAMDPQNSQTIYASLLGRGISKTVDGGANWTTAMNGLPAGADYTVAPTRFSLGISRPSAVVSATLYTGFEYYVGATRHASSVWKSTDDGLNWNPTNTAVIGDFCGSQCFYDDVMGVDPISPTIVYALGLYNYGTGSGGIYRSMDGGANWVDLGFNLHPDYHAIAIRKDNPSIVVIGNDGGAWWSSTRGGRLNTGDPLSATQWDNLNGVVDPNTAGVVSRSGLALGQFTSVGANPAVANRFYGGTQDNGTLRKATASQTWFDTASGDGGQVLVDPTDANYVYGTYYYFAGGPYRFTDGMGAFFSNQPIQGGINTNDRSEFYIPMYMDPANPNRLFLGTYRVYRTDNPKAPSAGDVRWNAISTDLTSGCTGTAPNGGRGCVITALGKSAGSNALYVGTMEGWIWLTPDSTVASPVWQRIDVTTTIPGRPIAGIAVDRSNYRVAYVAVNGFDPATPLTPGHVFKTANGGQSWTNITNNLPDVPVNSIDIDPSDPNTLYAGTDIGPYVSHNDGVSWTILGTGFPIVDVVQMALNPFTRQLVAATHGRGVWSLTDVTTTTLPALVLGKSAANIPYGPGSLLTYSVTVMNNGNITATNVVITDPVPANTSFVSAGSGGTLNGSNVVWTVPQVVPPSVVNTGGSLGVGLLPGSATVTFTVQITNTGVVTAGSIITNDGYLATSAQGVSAVGSPFPITLSPANAVAASPATQFDGTRAGQSVLYGVTVQNRGYNTDNFNLSATFGSFTATVWNAARTSTITQTGNVAPGGTVNVVLQVSVPPGASNGVTDTAALNVQSQGNAAVTTSASATTTAVTYDVLLVDNDDGAPNVQSFYQTALTTAGYNFNYYDLRTAPGHVLPTNFLMAHKSVVWFTGASYPGPLLPYESELAHYLDRGGRLFISGMDLLDQSAGTTAFVHDYLHINWDGTENQNDTGTTSVTALITSPVSSGLVTLTVNNAAAGLVDFNDQITPIFPAEPTFLDDTGEPDALQVDGGAYKVVFFAFPLEATGSAAQRANLIDRILKYFASNNAVTSVGVSGPATAQLNQPYAYTASVLPVTSTRPVTYMWMTTDQADQNNVGLLSDSATYTWTLRGAKTISVLASNEEGSAALAGTNEVPAINTPATGFAYFTYDRMTKMLSYHLSVSNIVTVTASHIHTGTIGVSGPIAIPLIAPVTGSSSGVVGPLNAAQEAALYGGGYYVNVHSTSYPGGEIRGQILFTGGYATTTFNVVVPYLVYLPVIRR